MKTRIELLQSKHYWTETIENAIQTNKTVKEIGKYIAEKFLELTKEETTNQEIIRLIWECEICNDIIISYSHLRHDMNFCECGKSAVDLEDYYQKEIGKVKELSRKKNDGGTWINVDICTKLKKPKTDWRIGKFYISNMFEVVQYEGCGNKQHCMVGKGNNQEEALKILKNRNKNKKFIEQRNIDNTIYYHYK